MRVIVKRRPLLSALEAAKHTFPDEFIGLFRGKREDDTITVDELIIAPLSTYGESYSAYSPWFLPPKIDSVGSFHSHPVGPALPSRADKEHFAIAGPVHFIATPPFTPETTACFDSKGKRIEFELK
ncbi:Mov34/MPN/PAD-1 family protein [Candidatus Micrarchaeota archaeon]|nr:Mov34/MPN/PAD-1 family protein [Candidatus Micrarchaeota archaeon]